MDDFKVPDAVGPVVGWRYWRVGRDGLLRSLTGRQHVWAPGARIEAECRFAGVDPDDWRYRMVTGYGAPAHTSPGEGCTCGIYASADLGQLRRQVLFGLRRMVVGEVSLWGKVIPASHGYRAQFAYPKRLLVFERVAATEPDVLGALADYRVPVEVIAQRDVSFRPLAALVPNRRK